MSPEEVVDRAAKVMEEATDANEEELRELLLKRAVAPFIADQLIVLVPLAFSRAHFEGLPMEKQHGNQFLLVDRKTGKEEKHRLDWNPFFCAATARARKLFRGSAADRERLRVVAQRSSEYQAIDAVLRQLPPGATPQAIGTSATTVLTDFPDANPKAPFQSSVRFREAYRSASAPPTKDCALAISVVVDAQHPIEEEIRHVNQCFLDWLARRGTECKQLVIAIEAAPDKNEKILELCQLLLHQDLGRESIIEKLETDLFLIDTARKTEKHFKLAWQSVF
jgi:hypothetical protein